MIFSGANCSRKFASGDEGPPIGGLFSSLCQLNEVEVLRMNERSHGASFEEVALPLFDALYNYARWLTGNSTEAEDLVQETYLKGLKGFGSFTPGTNFRAWMYRILRNTFLTSRTGLRAVPLISIDEEPGVLEHLTDEETPERHLLQRSNGEALRRAIEGLSLPFREVLLLCDVEEMSYKEIAETLSIPVGTVTSRLMRARQKVRNALRGMK
jgi:RNA polymerase sigma-70 factor (ECF subfamily)